MTQQPAWRSLGCTYRSCEQNAQAENAQRRTRNVLDVAQGARAASGMGTTTLGLGLAREADLGARGGLPTNPRMFRHTRFCDAQVLVACTDAITKQVLEQLGDVNAHGGTKQQQLLGCQWEPQ